MLLGESGTGKEVFARAIHEWSERKREPFIAINCVGLSKDLLESELFGHEKGAFTGAHQLKKGKMELAHGGTVFLDEVGDISAELQTKLLRFLQEREFERVGGTQPIRRRCSSHRRDQPRFVERDQRGPLSRGSFLSSQRDSDRAAAAARRREDIPVLAKYFLRRFAAETKKTVTVSRHEAEARLLAYDWPGNVRELANVIERAVVLGQGVDIALSDLPVQIAANGAECPSDDLSYRHALEAAKRDMCRQSPGAHQRQSCRRGESPRRAQDASARFDQIAGN